MTSVKNAVSSQWLPAVPPPPSSSMGAPSAASQSNCSRTAILTFSVVITPFVTILHLCHAHAEAPMHALQVLAWRTAMQYLYAGRNECRAHKRP